MSVQHDINEFLSTIGNTLRYKGTKFLLDYLTGSGARLPQINPDGSFSDSGLLLTQLALVANYGTFAVVTALGNDTTALVGRLDRPYATGQAAANALISQSGGFGAVVFMPGTHTIGTLTIDNNGTTPSILCFNATLNGSIVYRSQYGGGNTISGVNSTISGTITTSQYAAGNGLRIEGFNSIGSIQSGSSTTVRNVTTLGSFGSVSYATVEKVKISTFVALAAQLYPLKGSNNTFKDCDLTFADGQGIGEMGGYENIFDTCKITILGQTDPIGNATGRSWIGNYYPGKVILRNNRFITDRGIALLGSSWGGMDFYNNIIHKTANFVSPYLFSFTNNEKVSLFKNLANAPIINPATTFSADSLVYGNDYYMNADLSKI